MKTQNRHGFTLIELLVVIAIIAILAAILFPVFAQAREKARQTTCISNMKQIGLGCLQYFQDYDEAFPQLHYNQPAVQGGPEVRWADAISPYIKNGQIYSYDGRYSGAGGIWSCPSLPMPQPGNYGASYDLFREGACYGGGGNCSFVPQEIKLASLDTPSDTIMVVEKGLNEGNTSWLQFQTEENYWTWTGGGNAANNYNYPDHRDTLASEDEDNPNANMNNPPSNWGADWWPPNGSLMPRYRHNGTTDVLFCDGHVKAMHKGGINWYKNVYVPAAYQFPPVY